MLNFREKKIWIRRIWNHYSKARESPEKFMRTYFWDCLRGTFALLFGRYVEHSHFNSGLDIAWSPTEYSMCDFGTQESWETFEVISLLRYTIYDDSKY